MAEEFKKGRQFDLPKLYNLLFGYTGIPFPAAGVNLNLNPSGKVDALIDGTKFSEVAEEVEPFELEGDFITNAANGAQYVMPIKLDNYQLPLEPLIELRGKKIVKRTELTGEHRAGVTNKRGSVKELINIGDYKVTIRGVIIGNGGKYPDTEMRRLRRVIEKRASISIECQLTNIFGIKQIAIEGCNFPAVHGLVEAQGYELTAWSDQDFSTELVSQL